MPTLPSQTHIPFPSYRAAPTGWLHTDPNPFTPDGSYSGRWSAFCLLDREEDQFFTGQSGSGPFSARFGRRVAHLEHRLADFLRYENAHGRTVLFSFPADIDIDTYVAQALALSAGAAPVRPEDPAVIVHATSLAAWKQIQVDGELKAASQLGDRLEESRRPDTPGPLEEYLRHEPPEYRDYIMFGELNSCGPERVVASYQAGTFVCDDDTVFQPGVRLYFDHHRLIRAGMGTRDGLHLMKVHLRLPLEPYLLAAVGTADLDPQHEVAAWTVREFVEQANGHFCRRWAFPGTHLAPSL